MAYHPLDPDLVRHLLKGEVDELTARNQERIAQIKSTPCPRCGASLHPKLNAQSLFVDSDPLPRMLMSCECGFESTADTHVIIDRGSATKVKDPFPIIRGNDE